MISIRLLTKTDKFKAIGREWNILLAQSGISSPFLSWEWLYTWWDVYAGHDRKNQLAIVAAYEQDKLIALLPGYIRKETHYGIPMQVYAFLGSVNESSDYLQVIQPDPANPDIPLQLFRFLLDHEHLSIDLFDISNVLENIPFLQVFEKINDAGNFSQQIKHHRICPYIALEGTYADYVQGLSKNLRYNLRRRTRQLFEKNNASFGYITEKSQVDQGIDELFELHEKRFETKEAESIFQADFRKTFHKKIAKHFLELGYLRLFRLRLEGKTLAVQYCFEYADTLYYFQAGMDPAWDKQSVGLVLMGKVIEYAYEKNLKIYDLMRGGEAYKFRWTDSSRNMMRVYIGITVRSKLYLYLERLIENTKNILKQFMSEKTWHKLKRNTGLK